jgi:hypothetical protein
MSSSRDVIHASTPADGDRSDIVVACAVLMTSIATVAVGLRFYVRGKHLRLVKSEDWCILVSVVRVLARPITGLLPHQRELNGFPGI